VCIRTATSLDRDDVRGIYLSAFPEGEREIVSRLAVHLLSEETTPQTISLVAESEGAVVGHVAFSPVTIDNNERLQGYILAPLGVKPDYQRRRLGSKLIESGIKQLLVMGVNILFVYGEPKYYGRFGFSADAADRYTPPYRLQYPFGWQAIVLNECIIEKSPIKIACVTSLCDPQLW
jgi:putative acetyltransferase